MADSPSHESATSPREASPPLRLGSTTTHPGRVPRRGRPRGPSPRPPRYGLSRPGRAPLTPRAQAAPRPCSRPARIAAPRPLRPEPISRASGGKERRSRPSGAGTDWPATPSLTRRHSAPAFPTPRQKKRRLGRGGRQRHARSERARSPGRREGGTTGMRRLTRRREFGPAREPSTPRTKWRRWRRASCEAGPRPFPPLSPPSRRPGRSGGAPLAAPGAGGEGKGAARPTMQSVPRRRRRGRPVAKVKRSGSAADSAPPCPRTRPAPSAAAGPTPPRPLFQFYLRIWRQSGFGAGPVSATGGPRRGGQGVGRPGSRRRRGWREPGAAGSWGSGPETRRRGKSGGGPGAAAGVAGKGEFVIVFVSERSEFVTPVPLPPPPARW